MATKYKLYTVEEDRQTFHEEFYSLKDLNKFKIQPDEDIDLFECAERMVNKFNRSLQKGENKRYAYKLEKVTVRVIGSAPYYGLNISQEMCEPEFK
jgi:hypothetical protein